MECDSSLQKGSLYYLDDAFYGAFLCRYKESSVVGRFWPLTVHTYLG